MTDKILNVEGAKDVEGTYVRSDAKKDTDSFKWAIRYIDKMNATRTKGFNKDRGLHINRPFYIQSKLWLERVISVYSSKNLVIQTRKDKDHQRFFYDQASKTIKNVQFKDLSVDIRGGNAYVYKTDSRWYQLWKYEDEHFVNEKGQVLAIQSKLDTENRQVVRENKNDEDYQKWTVRYVDVTGPFPTSGYSKNWGMHINRPFHIQTQMSSGRFLDHISNRMVIKTRNGRPTQEFYFDYATRTIRSKGYNNYALDVRNTWAYSYGANSAWYQLFKYQEGKYFLNQHGKVLDANSKDAEGEYTTSAAKTGKTQQKWRIIYLDQRSKEMTKGMNMNRGLYVNRPFMIVSRMWMNRVVSVAGGWNLVIQTRKDNDKRQQWVFDMTSKTIKTIHDQKRSMDFRGGNAYAYTTDSRWYQLFKYDGGWVVNEKGQVLAVQSKLDYENR